MDIFKVPTDPFQLAMPEVEQLIPDTFQHTSAERSLLVRLDGAADALGFIGQKYFVEAGRSLAIPVSHTKDEPVVFGNFPATTFEGKFACYSRVSLGRVARGNPVSVRAFCATFTDVLLLPYLDKIPDDRLLYVPILAVTSVDPVE